MGRLFVSEWNWEELAQIARYDANELAKLCNVSARHLQRFFRRHFQRAPQHWLNERRLLAARSLLLTGDPVKKVALDLGFKQTSHFCREFKSRTHMTPSQFVLSKNGECRSGITDVALG